MYTYVNKSFFIQRHRGGRQWIFLSYNGRTWFFQKSATYVPIGGISISSLLFSYIIDQLCFLKNTMSVVWLQTPDIVSLCENETTLGHLITAHDSKACFCTPCSLFLFSLVIFRLLISRRLHLFLSNLPYLYRSWISYNERVCLLGILTKK